MYMYIVVFFFFFFFFELLCSLLGNNLAYEPELEDMWTELQDKVSIGGMIVVVLHWLIYSGTPRQWID